MIEGEFESMVKTDQMDKPKKFYKAKVSDNDIERRERDDINKERSMSSGF